MNNKSIEPIAFIENDYQEKFGIPRQPMLIESIPSRIVFEPKYAKPEAIRGIESFSHLWLVWGFSKNSYDMEQPSLTVRPPRMGGDARVGVFASRSPFRPNGLGLSVVKLVKIETQPTIALLVEGADLLNGTPIYDIKPYLPYADCIQEATSQYTPRPDLQRLEVIIPEEFQAILPNEKMDALRQILSGDPRPAYQKDPSRIYGFRYANVEVRFQVNDHFVTVVSMTPSMIED